MRPRARHLRRLLGRLLPLLAGPTTLDGCARLPRPADVGGTESSAVAAPEIPVRIENRNYNDVVIWLERSGARTRLGAVVGSSTATLAIPARLWQHPDGFQLAAETAGQRSARADGSSGIGDRRVVTERLAPVAGQRIVWTIESGLQRSHVGIQ